jgi:thiol-disulfide isomerase/thioredoxin
MKTLPILLAFMLLWLTPAASDAEEPIWASVDDTGQVTVALWFFWSEHCPHCKEAQPHIEALPEELPWVRLHSLRLEGHPEHVRRYRELAAVLGQEARSVPAALFCGQMVVGWGGPEVTGVQLRDGLVACRDAFQTRVLGQGESTVVRKPGSSRSVDLPLLGEVDPQAWSLPALTLVLGALDSFNPCAFFVLLFLLSLLVNAGSRRRMLAVGGLFISVSGLVYFLSMAAWLNLFMMVGHLIWITFGAGLLALVIGAINMKDYFLPRQGPSLSIPGAARPKLFERMRRLIAAGSLPTMLGAAGVLAVIANLYELLCTAGFPMVYTRVLTLHDLPPTGYYLYLVLYNLVYVVPLLLILLVFVLTLGRRKLQEREGRTLKLFAGLMMAGLGSVLLFAPEALGDLRTAIVLPLAAGGITWSVIRWKRE